jgi:DHA1 family inner membrane transport protein
VVTTGRVVTVAAMGAGGVVSHALGRTALPILLPAVESELLSNRRQAGFLGSANFVAYLVGVGLVTVVSGRVEPIRLLVAGLTVSLAGFVALAMAHGYTSLLVGQGLTGLGSAGVWMSAPAIAPAASTVRQRGLTLGFVSSSMGLGIVLVGQGTNLVRVLADDDGLWRPTFVGAAVFAAATLAVVALVIRVPPTAPVEGGVSLERLRTVPGWLVLSAGYWLFGLLGSSFTAFFGLLLKDRGFTAGHITNLFSLLGLAAVIGPFNLGWLSDRVGRRPVLTGSMLAMTAAAGLALTGREPWVATSVALFGATSFTFPVLVATYLRDHLHDRAFSNALGALTLIYGSALVVGPVAGGAVADSGLGIDAVFLALAVVGFFGAVAVALLPGSDPDGAVGAAEPAPSERASS